MDMMLLNYNLPTDINWGKYGISLILKKKSLMAK